MSIRPGARRLTDRSGFTYVQLRPCEVLACRWPVLSAAASAMRVLPGPRVPSRTSATTRPRMVGNHRRSVCLGRLLAGARAPRPRGDGCPVAPGPSVLVTAVGGSGAVGDSRAQSDARRSRTLTEGRAVSWPPDRNRAWVWSSAVTHAARDSAAASLRRARCAACDAALGVSLCAIATRRWV